MFRDFFKGRYGIDTYGIFIIFIAFFLIRFELIWILGVGLLLYAGFRMLSKNINRRIIEQQKFNAILQRIKKAFSREAILLKRFFNFLKNKFYYHKMVFSQRKEYEFVACPKCNKKLRLPRNKGKLQVTCPVCGFVFIKKT